MTFGRCHIALYIFVNNYYCLKYCKLNFLMHVTFPVLNIACALVHLVYIASTSTLKNYFIYEAQSMLRSSALQLMQLSFTTACMVHMNSNMARCTRTGTFTIGIQ